MGRKRKDKHARLREERMKRPARLQSAVSWLKTFDGENVLRGYCKHFGVDWRCAAIELKRLGVELDPDYLKHRESSDRQLADCRKRRRRALADESSSGHSVAYDSLLDAYLAEDYPALYAMECERDPSERCDDFEALTKKKGVH